MSKFSVMLSISRDWKLQLGSLYLIWSMKTDMQGLTIAIFRQKLNFFFRKIFSIFWGIEDFSFWKHNFHKNHKFFLCSLCFCQMFLVSLIFLFLQIFFIRYSPNNSMVVLNVPTYCLVRWLITINFLGYYFFTDDPPII